MAPSARASWRQSKRLNLRCPSSLVLLAARERHSIELARFSCYSAVTCLPGNDD